MREANDGISTSGLSKMSSPTQSHTHPESSRAHRARKARMGPRNDAPLIPAHTQAGDSLGAAMGEGGEGKERQRKAAHGPQEFTWGQGIASARFARLGTPSDPSRTAQKCICAGSPCKTIRPKYRYHRCQQQPTCANPPACSSNRKGEDMGEQ